MNLLGKNIFILLLSYSIIFSNGLQMDFGSDWIGTGSKSGTITNTTKQPYNLAGFRSNIVKTASTLTAYSPLSAPFKLGDSTDTEYRWEIPISGTNSSNIIKGNNKKLGFSINPSGLPWDDNSTNWTPTNIQWLIKTGTFASTKEYKDIDGISTELLAELVKEDWFYDSTIYVPDTLMGDRGGAASGGVINTWYDQDGDSALWQVQMCESSPFIQNGTWGTWNPFIMGQKDSTWGAGPMYAMSLAMVTEYFNLDYVFMAGSATNESMAGLEGIEFGGAHGDTANCSPNGQSMYNDFNTDLWMGTNHWEEPTFKDIIWEGCPKFFPEDPTYVHSNKYVTTPGTGKCIGNSPQIANDKLIVSVYNHYIYALLNNSTEFYIKDAFFKALDKEISAKLFLALWNGGRNSQDSFLEKLGTDANPILNNPELDWTVFGNDYIERVYRAIRPIQKGSKNSKVNGGNNIVYDHAIALSDIESFYFGTEGTPSAGILGNGGILHHFDLYSSERIEIWNKILAAFNILKQNGPFSEKGKISLRYDWLALMRTVKEHLNTSFPIPTNSDFTTWINVHSDYNVIDSLGGPTIENTFPILTKGLQTVENQEFSLPVKIKDETLLSLDSCKIVEWTLDTSWRSWEPASFVSGDSMEANYIIKIREEYASQYTDDLSKPFTLWIRGSDRNFNSTFDTATIQFNPVHQKTNVVKSVKGVKLNIEGQFFNIPLNLYKNSQSNLSIYSVKGQKLYDRYISMGERKISLNHHNFPKGIYILHLSSNNRSKSYKFQILE